MIRIRINLANSALTLPSLVIFIYKHTLTAIEGTKQSVIEFRTSAEKTAQKLDTLGLETFRTVENRKQIASQKQEIGFNTESAMHKASIAQQKAVELKEKAEALTTVACPAA